MRAERIQIRVFIEGVLVPKISAVTVQTFANEQAAASITMPSIPGFETEELKRARVHIFWSDIEIRGERADNAWPLLFEGEIVADGYSKSVTHRQQVFHCAGYHTYWEQVMLYYYDLNASPGTLTAHTDRISVAMGNKSFELESRIPGASLRQRLAVKILEGKDKAYHSLIKEVFKDCLQVNHFFVQADAILKLSNRFVSVKDPNLDLLIGRDLLHSAITHDVLTMQGEASMMMLLKNTLELCRYQIVHNAQPVFVDGSRDERRTSQSVSRDEKQTLRNLDDYLIADFPTLSDTLRESTVNAVDGTLSPSRIKDLANAVIKEAQGSEEDQLLLESHLTLVNATMKDLKDPHYRGEGKDLDKNGDELLAQYLLVPRDTNFALPPACNVIFPEDQTSLYMDRQLLQEPTRGLGMPEDVLGGPFRLYLTPPEIENAKIPQTIISPLSGNELHPPIIRRCRVTSPFGVWRKKVIDENGNVVKVQKAENTDGATQHKGIDISCGNFLGTDLYAVDDGKVTLFNTSGSGGLQLGISHGNFSVYYCHLSSRLVKRGQMVKRGQVVAKGGNTGHSTGPHLHFEVMKDGKKIDPTEIAPPSWGWKNVKNHIIPAYKGVEKTTAPVSTATTDEKSITEDLKEKSTTKTFLDYKFLTPEEEKVGIVPFFDRNTLRTHAYMAFVDEAGLTDQHYLNMLNAEFLQRRYQTRSIGSLSLPFNPYPIAGFPALVVDRSRSVIGQIVSIVHNITVGGGQGSATTSVQIETPRYWDEGDPYFWKKGKVTKEPSSVKGFEGRDLPKSDSSSFPAYYLDKLVGTNSSPDGKDIWWDDKIENPEKQLRPVDEFYRSLLGVFAIPYQYATRRIATGQTVTYNKAIYGRDAELDNVEGGGSQPAKLETRDDRKKYPNTIVGRYYLLMDKDPELANLYVRNMTRRLGVSEYELMTKVLDASPNSGAVTYFYSAPAFRSEYQLLVRKMNLILAGQPAFRG